MRNKIISVLMCVVILLAVMTNTACTMPEQPQSVEGFYFDTYISVTIYGGNKKTLDKVLDICSRYDSLLDKYDKNSDIYKINNSDGHKVSVDPDVIEIIELGLYYSEISGGVFDITCGSATSLWDFNAEKPEIPDENARNQAVKLIDYTAVEIIGNEVFVPNGVQLDLGGIAKGFVADKIAEFLEKSGVEDALIDLGGNIYALGDKLGASWRIGIKAPDNSGYIGTVETSAKTSIVTSGDYERCFVIDSVRYHHILDLKTAMPAITDIRSVTIISESSAQGDALSTICFVLGYEKASDLLAQIDGAEAVFVLDDGTVVETASILA